MCGLKKTDRKYCGLLKRKRHLLRQEVIGKSSPPRQVSRTVSELLRGEVDDIMPLIYTVKAKVLHRKNQSITSRGYTTQEPPTSSKT